ncbi:hypothetical protein B0T26DRAFT_681662 [Lasiosphaeria miniovina]|uniref:Nephrocystin 3-like N-terminal domain-containing protein n=1 Tax=Lasiosphaeria miniovina TaxID=1954250 RepID=A0AA39ZUT5_9PEZI|nr:uncharacterized protein B0T26DRAFT_681662 [Lasiosphaeria miniovina]KAK0704053.1 hypothetical protein B0T26DRAFT_681662 [Lasiosphaeria miniovina]
MDEDFTFSNELDCNSHMIEHHRDSFLPQELLLLAAGGSDGSDDAPYMPGTGDSINGSEPDDSEFDLRVFENILKDIDNLADQSLDQHTETPTAEALLAIIDADDISMRSLSEQLDNLLKLSWKIQDRFSGPSDVVEREHADDIANSLQRIGDDESIFLAPQTNLPWAAYPELMISVIDVTLPAKLADLAPTTTQTSRKLANLNTTTASLGRLYSLASQLEDAARLCKRTKTTDIDDEVVELMQEMPEVRRIRHDRDGSSSINSNSGDVDIDEERLGWISNVPYESQHDDITAFRTPGLRLQGSVGTSKTFLASRVVDHMRNKATGSVGSEGVVFFYCGHASASDWQLGVPQPVIRSLVQQLLISSPRLSEKITGLMIHSQHCGRIKSGLWRSFRHTPE